MGSLLYHINPIFFLAKGTFEGINHKRLPPSLEYPRHDSQRLVMAFYFCWEEAFYGVIDQMVNLQLKKKKKLTPKQMN